jgi:ABC-type Mn2+/Zn2+ transport system permease subunit
MTTFAAPNLLAASAGLPDVLTTGAVAVACAVLSVFVVSRRWAFIGEGISHSGFGGAGTVWLLALAFPALDALWAVYAGVVVFCLATGLGIAYFSRARGVAPRANTDAVIGIFLVASVAWGFLGRELYRRSRGDTPAEADNVLFGQSPDLPPAFAIAAALVCAAVVVTVALLLKEIVYYCFDPAMAEASGVRAAFVHYLLVVLVTLTIIVGVPVAGSILVTALLVLPGATALLLSDRLRTTVTASVVVGVAGAAAALLLRAQYPFFPMGPAIVLAMFVLFLVAYAWSRARGRGTAQ